jgi:hypothetical protein
LRIFRVTIFLSLLRINYLVKGRGDLESATLARDLLDFSGRTMIEHGAAKRNMVVPSAKQWFSRKSHLKGPRTSRSK